MYIRGQSGLVVKRPPGNQEVGGFEPHYSNAGGKSKNGHGIAPCTEDAPMVHQDLSGRPAELGLEKKKKKITKYTTHSSMLGACNHPEHHHLLIKFNWSTTCSILHFLNSEVFREKIFQVGKIVWRGCLKTQSKIQSYIQ